jgi:hypothetical protein
VTDLPLYFKAKIREYLGDRPDLARKFSAI